MPSSARGVRHGSGASSFTLVLCSACGELQPRQRGVTQYFRRTCIVHALRARWKCLSFKDNPRAL
jgi:hypothetical protein